MCHVVSTIIARYTVSNIETRLDTSCLLKFVPECMLVFDAACVQFPRKEMKGVKNNDCFF